jgi:hypothetical protein
VATAGKIAWKSCLLLNSLPFFCDLALNLFGIALLFHTHTPALSCEML